MERFNELKEKILRVSKDQSACSEQYKRAYSAETMSDLCTVIKDNFNWCCNNEVLTGSLIGEFKIEFAKENIFHNENVKGAYLIASGSSTVIAYGSSTVRAYDSSTVEAYDSSTVRASGSSTVRAYGSSTVRAYDSSTVEAYDSSTVEAYDSSTVRASGSSTVRASGSSYINSHSLIGCKISDKAILRHNGVVSCCGKSIETT